MPRPHLPPRYEMVAPLGKGGGGEVWAVRDRITGRKVALKALREGADEREVMALVREAVSLSGVEGLGVPHVLRFGTLPRPAPAPGERESRRGVRPYMVRELVEGESLADVLDRGGAPRAHLAAVAQAADQLTRLHRALLLHGDLKPANIIVGTDARGRMRASLVDLGLAAPWREGGAKPEGLTPRYAAPELFEGAPLTVRAEVFALGATIAEVLRVSGESLAADIIGELDAVVARATSADPNARYPSADELGSALRRAARLGESSDELLGSAWPIVGIDAASSRLLAQVDALPAGGGIVISGPRGSGRSALLRRAAWSLGVAGRAVAWIETGQVRDAAEAVDIELAAHPPTAELVILVDDASRLGSVQLERLDDLRQAGARLVFVVTAEDGSAALPGATFEIFEMAPLAAGPAAELVRRAIPSLSDAAVAHVVDLSGGWPGRLRAAVTRLERAPVVSPADVDRLLEDTPLSSGGSAGGTADEERAEIHRLLDRGHFEDAAVVLDRHKHDPSPWMAIARSRLATNRGDPVRALAELERVRNDAEGADDDALAASWLLHSARAQLRAGNYAESERLAAAVATRLLPASPPDGTLVGKASGKSFAAGSEAANAATDALSVKGLAQSFASRHGEAKATLDEAVAMARAAGDPRVLSVALGSLAFALQRDDQLSEAKSVYEEALGAAEQAGDAGNVATLRLNLATIAQTRGDLAPALSHLEAAVDMGRRSGRTATLRQALLNLASLELYLGRLARARSSIDALAEQRGELPPQLYAQLLALEAEYAAHSGDLGTADRLCAECAEAYETMRRPVDAAEARLERVLFAAEVPGAEPEPLRREVARATALLGETTAHRALTALARGRVAALAGEEDAARAGYDEAFELARAAGQRDLLWRALDARARLEMGAGQSLKARRDRESALATLEEIAARLPRDLREVYWNAPRRHALRSASLLELSSGQTVAASAPTEDRLARVLEINREIAGEHDLGRLLERVTDHAIALLRAERGFVILRGLRDTGSSTTSRPAGMRVPASRPASTTAATGSESSTSPSTGAAPEGSASTWDDGGGSAASMTSELFIRASRDQTGEDSHARFSRSIADKVIKSGEPVVTSSARDDARMADYVSVHQLMLQSVACVPIRARDGTVLGALYLETRLRPAGSFSDEMPTLMAFADQVAIAIETARLVGENARRAAALAEANTELEAARVKLEELLGHRTAQLQSTRRELRNTKAVLRSHFGYQGLVGTTEAMRRVYALVERVKDTDVPVLITGESGTGKEIVARAIHNAGARGKRPFVGINCGAIPENLLESELFGHVRGAFTGADRDRRGLFREATEGSILLDEIGEMPPKMQAGLLRVLQEKLVRPVGGTREEPVDTRVIAATHRDLAGMVEAGTFREDLFYRLNVIQLRVPSLRERLDDIPILIDHFLGIFAARYGRERRQVSRTALRRLMAYGWPGNVRQLENVLLNAWVLSDAPELLPEDFELPDAARSLRPTSDHDAPRSAVGSQPRPRATEAPSSSRFETSLDEHRASERERILQALSSCNWNRVKAAQLIGLPRRTFYRRLKEYGIQ